MSFIAVNRDIISNEISKDEIYMNETWKKLMLFQISDIRMVEKVQEKGKCSCCYWNVIPASEFQIELVYKSDDNSKESILILHLILDEDRNQKNIYWLFNDLKISCDIDYGIITMSERSVSENIKNIRLFLEMEYIQEDTFDESMESILKKQCEMITSIWLKKVDLILSKGIENNDISVEEKKVIRGINELLYRFLTL